MIFRKHLAITLVIINLAFKCHCLNIEALFNSTDYDEEEDESGSSDYSELQSERERIPCEIPNEDKLGVCLGVSQCSAYLQVRNGSHLPAEKVNFLKKVQCVSNISYDVRAHSLEPLVCCTANGQDYRFPSIQFTKFEYRRFHDATARFKRKKLKRRIQTVEPVEGLNLWNECGKQVTHRIYGGEIAELDEFPWLALLVYNSRFAMDLFNLEGRIYASVIITPSEPYLTHSVLATGYLVVDIRIDKTGYKITNSNNDFITHNQCWAKYMVCDDFGCSGALIDDRHLLTAAHCVHGEGYREKKGLKHVRLGEFNVKTEPDCIEEPNYLSCADASVDIGVDEIFVHPDYKENSFNKFNDIAVIRLKHPVSFTHFIMPICLPNKTEEISLEEGQMFSVSGWGKTDLFNKYFINIHSPIKLKLRIPLVAKENCSKVLDLFGMQLSSKQLCAGGEYAKDTCAGDSGGPLMYFDRKHSRWVTYGIVSYGFTQCGIAGHPAVYTNVSEYLDWIHTVIDKVS